MSYKPQTQIDIENSSAYAVRHWRKGEAAEESLDDFLFWLEYAEDAPEISKDTLHNIELLVDLYLHRDMQKIKRGELELLDQWIKATRSIK